MAERKTESTARKIASRVIKDQVHYQLTKPGRPCATGYKRRLADLALKEN